MKVRSDRLRPSVVRALAAVCAAVFATSANPAQADFNVWTSNGPEGVNAVALAIEPSTHRTRYAGADRGVLSLEQVTVARVVGTGTAASCTDAALNTALAGGGLVTFNCGPDPVTIDINTGTGTKTIATDTTVDGGGLITISGGNTVRVFSVDVSVKFTVDNLTIANGRSDSDSGGGISTNDNGTLTVTNTTFTGNSAVSGGGINNVGGTATVTNSTFGSNSATVLCIETDEGTSCHGGGGGGIYNDRGTLTVANSAFTSDGALAGGAIFNHSGTLTITNSTFSGNAATDSDATAFGVPFGGGIFSGGGTLTVTNSTFSGNSGGAGGGGIANLDRGSLTVTNSTFTDNSGGGGGGISNGGSLTVTDSTFSGNSAGRGGGIGNGSTLTVTNSTFSGNSAVFGGGIDDDGGSMTVTNSTFTGNSAAPGAGHGGGISSSGSSGNGALLRNTIVADSPSDDNCSGRITDGGHNLDDGTSCGFSPANGSLSSTAAELDPAGLRDNGGPTETVALCIQAAVPAGCSVASPAIAAGDPAFCAAAPVNDLDQRGFVRPRNTQCSIGAYEPDATAPECVGDCNGGGSVTVNELVVGVNIVLSDATLDQCQAFDCNDSGHVTVDCLVRAVNNVLNGCVAMCSAAVCDGTPGSG